MRRTFAVLALPATLLAIMGVLFGSSYSAPAGAGVSSDVAAVSRTADLRRVETGAAVAVTQTNWEETGSGSPIVPNGNGGGGNKR